MVSNKLQSNNLFIYSSSSISENRKKLKTCKDFRVSYQKLVWIFFCHEEDWKVTLRFDKMIAFNFKCQKLQPTESAVFSLFTES